MALGRLIIAQKVRKDDLELMPHNSELYFNVYIIFNIKSYINILFNISYKIFLIFIFGDFNIYINI